MKHITFTLSLILALIIVSCNKDQMIPAAQIDASLRSMVANAAPDGDLDYWLLPQADDLASIPQDPQNPLTEEKVELGKFLFFETAFGNISELYY